jgi:hypothetical protein
MEMGSGGASPRAKTATVDRPAEALRAARALGERVRPVALARERVLPVHPSLGSLFPDGGLLRGSVLACEGAGAHTLALALTAAATQAGAWMAIVGVDSLGLPAAVELGVAPERVFRVALPAGAPPDQLATVLAAAVDGAEIVLACGVGVRAGDARRLAARLTTRGGLLVLTGPVGGFVPDLRCAVTARRWEGLGTGSGRLTSCLATVEAGGRRAERRRRVDVWFPAADGQLAPTSTELVNRERPSTAAGSPVGEEERRAG